MGSFLTKRAITKTESAIFVVLIVITAAVAYYLGVTLPPDIFLVQPAPTQTPAETTTPTPTVTPTYTSTPTPTPTSELTPSPTPAATPIPNYSLSEAVAAGYVEANITGNSLHLLGTSSGDSIHLNLERLVNYAIEIDVFPTGTLLVPSSGDAQSMAILELRGLYSGLVCYRQDRIILDTQDSVRYLYSAYCVSFDKGNPTGATLFIQSGLADSEVIKIYDVIDQLPEDVTGVAAIQTAVFVVTDDISLAELESRFSSGVDEVENARTILETAGIDISTKALFS
jgi:hypothetical protein